MAWASKFVGPHELAFESTSLTQNSDSMVYASRFTCVDYFHWIYEMVRYVFVGTAAAHVNELELMREASSAALAFIVASCAKV